MSLTFLFWLSALYTLALFGVQVLMLVLPGRLLFNATVLNAFYLALLSAYVGGKEVHRWRTDAPTKPTRPLWLRGEWFVGLWAVFLLVATFLSQLWPQRFAYPEGLTLIAFEIFTLYAGSSASAWLNRMREEKDHIALDHELAEDGSETNVPEPRLSKKRQRYESQALALAEGPEGATRETFEKRLRLSRAATLRLLSDLIDRGLIRRSGDPGDTNTRYHRT